MRWTTLLCSLLCAAWGAAATPDVLAQRREASEALRAGNHETAAQLYRELVRDNPQDGALWEALGLSLLRSGEHEAAVLAYRASIATGLRPASGYYNIACALSQAGKLDAAIDALAQAYALGFANEHLLRQDSDLAPLHENPEFRRLVGWPDPSLESRSERWRRDLEFLDRRLREVHWDLFGQCSQSEYESIRERLLSQIDELDDDRLAWRIQCWLARIGDGHTALSSDEFLALHLGPHADMQLMPIQFFEYPEGIRIKQATPAYAELAGQRVLGIGDAGIDSLLAWIEPGCSSDNESGARWMRSLLLSDPRVLRGIGVAQSDQKVRLQLEDERGRASEVEVELGGAELVQARRPFWALGEQPRSLAQREWQQSLFVEPDAEHDLLYVRMDGVHDGPTESLADFAVRVTSLRRQWKLGRLVLDLRNNHGGQGELLRPFLHELIRDADFQAPGSLYVLVGRETFSAAMAFAAQVEVNTRARFVGEPSGSRPNFVGETTLVQLPYSQRWVSISSRYHQNGRSDDRRFWIAPSIPAAPDFALERAGRDPALEAIAQESAAAH